MSAFICNNPFAVPPIDLDECIGTSLAKINKNFQDIYEVNCGVYRELDLIQNDLKTLSSNFIALSSIKNNNIYPKIWVSFDGTTTTPTICSVYSVSGIPTVSVRRIPGFNTGYYALSFTTAFPNISYSLIGTAKSVETSACLVQPISSTPFYTVSANINVMTLSGTYINSDYITVAIYSL